MVNFLRFIHKIEKEINKNRSGKIYYRLFLPKITYTQSFLKKLHSMTCIQDHICTNIGSADPDHICVSK
jgi:hypothetical protein